MSKLRLEHQLVGMIYEAALNVQLWPLILEKIVELSGSNTAIITTLDQLNPNYEMIFTHNIPQEVLTTYREEHLDVVDMENHGQQMIGEGIGNPVQIITNYDIENYMDTPVRNFYDKCLKPSNIYYMAGVLLEYDQYRWAVLGIHRPKNASIYTKEELEFIGELSIHIRRSLQLYRQIASLQHQNRQLYQLFDQMAIGVFFLNDSQQVKYTNKYAEQLLTKVRVLKVDSARHLKTSIDQQDALNQLIRSALFSIDEQTHLAQSGGVINLYNEYGETELILTISPLSTFSFFDQGEANNIAIFLTDPNAKYTLPAPLLKKMYGLSTREIQICEIFINYPTLEQTAKMCGLTLASLRTYMKKIYEKTRQHSQAELLHLLTRLELRFEHIQ